MKKERQKYILIGKKEGEKNNINNIVLLLFSYLKIFSLFLYCSPSTSGAFPSTLSGLDCSSVVVILYKSFQSLPI